MKNSFLFLIVSLFLTGCTYKTPVDISPSYAVQCNYDTKVPGHFALYVDADEMNQKIKVRGYVCSAHTYPVEASEQFKMSVYKTFENLLEKVTMVETPLTIEQLKKNNYKAMIKMEVKDLDVELDLIQGFWASELEGETEISASLTADGIDGRKLGFSAEGDGKYVAPSGGACEGGAKAIGGSIEKAYGENRRKCC